MPRTPQASAAWVQGGPKRTANGGDWEGGCVAAVYNAGQFGHSYDFAVQAAAAAGARYAGGHALPTSGTLNTNPNAAGDGSVHYWGGIWNSEFNRWDGHIAFQYAGRLYMASVYAPTQYGHHLGSCTWQQYQTARGLPYLGHAPHFGNQPFAGVDPASLNQTDLGGDDMPINQDDANLIAQTLWTYQLGNKGGGKGAIFGRAADWLTNMSDAVGGLVANSGQDPKVLAQAIAPLVIPSIVAAVNSAGGGSLTEAQAQAASEAALVDFFGKAVKS